MGNFDFLRETLPGVFPDSARAESYLTSDPRAACIYSRRAAELLVNHLYDVLALREPYRDDFAAKANDPVFKARVGSGIQAKLNLIHCYRSMNYIARHMEEKYGIPWMEYNFFGPSQIAASLRKIAKHFGPEIEAKAEEVIAKYKPLVDSITEKYGPRLKGKKVMLYVGGLRPRHTVGAYEDLGMEVVGAGYEFAHNDDYDRTIKELKDATLIYDDASGYELEEFVRQVKPDLVGSGIKEKYAFHKMGVPFRQMHSWDYSGPYHGFDGFAIFARDMDIALSNPTFKNLTPPWKKVVEDEAKKAA